MNVVVVDTSRSEGPRLHGVLTRRGVPARLAVERPRAVGLLEEEAADLVLLCARRPDAEVLGFAEHLRERLVLEPASLQIVCEPLDDDAVVQVFDAGIDAVVPWGAGEEQLVARVAAVARQLDRVERKATAAPFRAGDEDGAGLPTRLIYRSNAWRSSAVLLREIVARFFSHAALPVSVDVDGALDRAAACFLTSHVHGAQIRCGVGANNESVRVLAAKFFGHDADHLVDDMLAELASVLAGALKTRLAHELLPFTAGLPFALPASELTRPTTTYAHRTQLAFAIGHAQLRIQLGLSAKALSSVDVALLLEGMIIAHDLVDARGLLLRRGTRLSSSMVKKLRELLPPHERIQVMLS
jgi:hypothetical protein